MIRCWIIWKIRFPVIIDAPCYANCHFHATRIFIIANMQQWRVTLNVCTYARVLRARVTCYMFSSHPNAFTCPSACVRICFAQNERNTTRECGETDFSRRVRYMKFVTYYTPEISISRWIAMWHTLKSNSLLCSRHIWTDARVRK